MNNVQRRGTAIAQKSDGISFPVQPAVPGIASFLKGCNFSNCNVTFTASTASTNESQFKCKSYAEAELLEGISIEELFAD